jgi:hypothetical protein
MMILLKGDDGIGIRIELVYVWVTQSYESGLGHLDRANRVLTCSDMFCVIAAHGNIRSRCQLSMSTSEVDLDQADNLTQNDLKPDWRSCSPTNGSEVKAIASLAK